MPRQSILDKKVSVRRCTQAESSFTLSAFKKSMAGIYTTTVSQDTLDECPMAYKDPQTIISAIGDTVRIEKQIRPIYNFKSSDRFTSKKRNEDQSS